VAVGSGFLLLLGIGPAQAAVSQPAAQRLVVPAAAAGQEVGDSVAISGQIAVVSGTDEVAPSTSGTAYVYRHTPQGHWLLQQTLTPPKGDHGDPVFARQVAVSGATILVNAPGIDQALVYQLDHGTWTLAGRLRDPAPTADDAYGSSVALSADTAIVGAQAAPVGSTEVSGAAYVFTHTARGWALQATLPDPAATTFDRFGAAAALSDNAAIIGAWGTNGGSGAAYIYTRQSDGSWALSASLRDPEPVPNNQNFGSSVAINGPTAAVGSPSGDHYRGTAFAYTDAGSHGWHLQQKLIPRTGAAIFDFWGSSVAVGNGEIVVGADELPVPEANSGGAAWVFLRPGRRWIHSETLLPSRKDSGEVGFSAAVSGTTAVLGVPSAQPSIAYAYTIG
jgi:hypothetical protein